VKRSDYPGSDLPRKELHKRLMAAYQLAGRLLIAPDDPADVRSEMEIVLLDFLSDPDTADCDRLELAVRAFHSRTPRIKTTTTGTASGPITFTEHSA